MKVIFLDIDGVIQPENSKKRFTDFDPKEVLIQTPLGLKKQGLLRTSNTQKAAKEMLSLDLLHGYLIQLDSAYAQLDRYDVAAVCCDWNIESVDLLYQLCSNTGAKIVISSDWRIDRNFEYLKLLFRIYELDGFVFDTIDPVYGNRPSQIKEYVKTNSNIEKFVIFDDCFRDGFEKMFPDEFIYHKKCFDKELYSRAEALLC